MDASPLKVQTELIDQLLTQERVARAEALNDALRESEGHFRALADTIPLLAWYAQPDGRVSWFNRRWHQYVGLPLDAQEGWQWPSALDPADVARVTQKWRRSLETGDAFEDEFPLRRHDGAFRWFLTRVTALRDSAGRIVRWFGTHVDIDDQKRAAITSEFLARTTAAAADSLDESTTLQNVTRAVVPDLAEWCAVYLQRDGGLCLAALCHRDPALGARLRALCEHHPLAPDAPCGPAKVARTQQSEVVPEVTDAMLVALARDPAQLDLWRSLGATSGMAVPLVAHGQVLGALSLARTDPTRSFDSRDIAWGEELGRSVAVAIQHARLFEVTRQERQRAEALSRARDELLTFTSHELRTPLNAILGWSHVLRTTALGDDKRAHAIETIERNAKTLVRLVEDLLDAGQVISGRLRLRVAPVDLRGVVEAAVEVARPAAQARAVQLQVALGPDVAGVLGDAERLQQIVWNLLSNALKFTPKGGLVRIGLRRDGDHAELVVADSGEGIVPGFLPHVFESFRQEDASLTRAHGGLGLGLTLVKHLVELHGGQIEARSEGKDRGATFVVRIPAAPTDPQGAPATADATAPPTRALDCALEGLHVLVVDDEPDLLDLLGAILVQCKATVSTASSAALALDLFQEHPPDVLISDLAMPDESGNALIRKVRALPLEAGGRTPAIALTAYASASDRALALAEGFTAHAPKPIEPQALVALIAALVGRSR